MSQDKIKNGCVSILSKKPVQVSLRQGAPTATEVPENHAFLTLAVEFHD